MAWIELDALDPETSGHRIVAHGSDAEEFQSRIDTPPSPAEERDELTKRLRARIPSDQVILGSSEFKELVGTATPEQLDSMRSRLEELDVLVQDDMAYLAIAS